MKIPTLMLRLSWTETGEQKGKWWQRFPTTNSFLSSSFSLPLLTHGLFWQLWECCFGRRFQYMPLQGQLGHPCVCMPESHSYQGLLCLHLDPSEGERRASPPRPPFIYLIEPNLIYSPLSLLKFIFSSLSVMLSLTLLLNRHQYWACKNLDFE